jgi:chemotaxis protein histidine kinase CheA
MSQSDNDSGIVKEFLVESYENLDRLDRELVGLEKNPDDRDALASVFRTIHTIKGTCGFLGFNKLEKVASRRARIGSGAWRCAPFMKAGRSTSKSVTMAPA